MADGSALARLQLGVGQRQRVLHDAGNRHARERNRARHRAGAASGTLHLIRVDGRRGRRMARCLYEWSSCAGGVDVTASSTKPPSVGVEPSIGATTPQQTRVGKPRSANMPPGPGFRMRYGLARPDKHVVAGLSEFSTPEISDLLNRLYTMESAIRVLTDDAHTLCGPACTVKVYPGDNLAVHKSIDIAQPGDVIVIDAAATPLNSVLGGFVAAKARHRGVQGFVVDGLVRDLSAIRQLHDFPVFARGLSPTGPMHRGPGEVNYPVSCGRIVVQSGDVVVADLNGVVVIPKDIAEGVLERLRRHAQVEADYAVAIARGEFSNAWVDTLLDNAGVKVQYGAHQDCQCQYVLDLALADTLEMAEGRRRRRVDDVTITELLY